MTRRMLDSTILQNEKFASMPVMARMLVVGMVVTADDQGRGKAHPVFLRSQIFPYEDVPQVDIEQWLALAAKNETVLIYSVDGKDYYQFVNWWTYQSHQYAMPSQFPKPPGWSDRIRKSITKGHIVTCNWITSDGTHSPDTCDEQGKLIQVSDQVVKQVNDQVNDQVIKQVDVQPEDTSLSLSLSLSSSLSLTPNGRAEDALIDPELTQALVRWRETFTGTPWEGNPPIAQLPKWIAYGGVDVLCYMIDKAKDKDNPGGYLYTTFDNWRKDGEIAPFVVKQAEKAKNGSDPVKTEQRTVIYSDGSTELQEVQPLGR